jgi:hypothetical protein
MSDTDSVDGSGTICVDSENGENGKNGENG